MRKILGFAAMSVVLAASALAENIDPIPAPSAQDLTVPTISQANAQIDYDGFTQLAADLKETREARLLTLQAFEDMRKRDDVILLDTRSAAAFARGHISGAINLPFSDFTDDKLAKVLGTDTGRPILIYCNNNFSDNVPPVMAKKVELALNIPTFINLHGYGYTNIWELGEVVSISDVDWVRSEPSTP